MSPKKRAVADRPPMPGAVNLALRGVQDAVAGFSHLFFPRSCAACGCVCSREEGWLCLACETALPWTAYQRESGHRLERQFWGRVPLENAWAAWHMGQEGPVRRIVHTLKYRQRPDLAREAGRVYARHLLADGQGENLDGLAFVPMAASKERARGYNPAREIAAGMAEVFTLPLYDKALERLAGAASQTRKDRAERWASVSRLYGPGPMLKPHWKQRPQTRWKPRFKQRLQLPAEQDHGRETSPLDGQHVLLVDDVVTSGATLEACVLPLQAAGARVTVAALAAAD